jgi:hypothetical protein
MAALLAVELAPTCKLCNAVFGETVHAEEGSATVAGSSVKDVAFLTAGVRSATDLWEHCSVAVTEW